MADRPRRRRFDDDEDDDRPRRRRRFDEDDEDEDDYDDRPRRRRAAASNGAAMASLVLGILSFCLSALAGIPAIVFGVVGLSKAGRAGTGRGMAIAGLSLGLAGTIATGTAGYLLYRATKKGIDRVMEVAKNSQDSNNLKEIGLGMHNHADRTGALPPALTTAGDMAIDRKGLPDGTRMRGWRHDLLPFVGEAGLFSRFDITRPWDDPKNRLVADTPVRVYWPADQPNTTNTRYRVFTGPGTPFPKPGYKPRFPADFPDGLSNTILVAESAELGPWAEPKDMPVTASGSIPALGKPGAERFLVVMGDGSTRMVRKTIDPKVLRWLIDPKDGNAVPIDFDR
jgi:Protein of unknown function (DUF1559)/Domain of unknown function (DUF4190)